MVLRKLYSYCTFHHVTLQILLIMGFPDTVYKKTESLPRYLDGHWQPVRQTGILSCVDSFTLGVVCIGNTIQNSKSSHHTVLINLDAQKAPELRQAKSLRFLVSARVASDPRVCIFKSFFCYETMSNCSQNCWIDQNSAVLCVLNNLNVCRIWHLWGISY